MAAPVRLIDQSRSRPRRFCLDSDLGRQGDCAIAPRLSTLSGLAVLVVLAGCGGKSHTTSTATTGGPVSPQAPESAPPAARSIGTRVLQPAELPGFASQGTRPSTSAADWVNQNALPKAQAAKEVARLKGLGFIAGANEQLATKNGDAEGLSIVEQFTSPRGASGELAAQLRKSRASRNYAAFRVSGIPGARGFDLSDKRSTGHNVVFTDGPYYYLVGTGTATGTPRAPTRADTIDAAFRLYRRVHG